MLKLRCPGCPEEADALLAAPRAERSLAKMSEMLEGAGQAGPPCPACGARMQPESLAYEFDEPGLPEVLVASSGQALCGSTPVSSEADVLAAAGRPLDAAGHARRQVQDAPLGGSAFVMSPGEAVMVGKLAGEPDEAKIAAAAEQSMAAVKGLGVLSGEALPVGWIAAGAAAWMGVDLAEELESGRTTVFTLADAGVLIQALSAAPDSEDPGGGPPVSYEAGGGGQPLARLGELTCEIDVDRTAVAAAAGPLTIAEAAADARVLAARELRCCAEAIDLLAASGDMDGVKVLPGCRLEISGPGGVSMHAELAQICQRLNFDAVAAAGSVRDARRQAQEPGGPFGVRHPCGCEPRPGLVVRPASQAEGLLARDIGGGAALCAVKDCEHHTSFVPAGGISGDEEAAWEEAIAGSFDQEFSVEFAEEIRGASGTVTAVLMAGHNIGTAAAHPDFARSLAAAAGISGPGEALIEAQSADYAAVTVPGADPRTAHAALAQLARTMSQSPHAMQGRFGLERQFSLQGGRAGVFRMPGPPPSRAHRRAAAKGKARAGSQEPWRWPG